MATRITTAVAGVARRESVYRRAGVHDLRGQLTPEEPIIVVGRTGLSNSA